MRSGKNKLTDLAGIDKNRVKIRVGKGNYIC